MQFGNPELSRIASRVKSLQLAELLTMLQLLLPGTISVYYGDEIGMMDLPTEKLVSSAHFPLNISKSEVIVWLFAGTSPKRCYAVG